MADLSYPAALGTTLPVAYPASLGLGLLLAGL